MLALALLCTSLRSSRTSALRSSSALAAAMGSVEVATPVQQDVATNEQASRRILRNTDVCYISLLVSQHVEAVRAVERLRLAVRTVFVLSLVDRRVYIDERCYPNHLPDQRRLQGVAASRQVAGAWAEAYL